MGRRRLSTESAESQAAATYACCFGNSLDPSGTGARNKKLVVYEVMG